MKWLTGLKVDRAVLRLKQCIRGKLSVKRMQVLVCSTGPVVPGLHVIDESSPDHDSLMWSKCCGHHICSIDVIAVRGPRPRLALAVCLYEQTAKIRDYLINLIRLFFP